MHDLDRTLQEFGDEFEQHAEGFEFELLSEDESEFEGAYESELEYEYEYLGESVFDEVEEMELASELLETASEEELDQFFGKLISSAAKGIRGFAKSPMGNALGGVLKNVAKVALPVAGAVGGSLLMPGVGTTMGAKLGSAAGRMFGLELEGMTPEDQEFEVARRIVRLSGDAAQEAANTPQDGDPDKVVKKIVVHKTQKHAPALARVVVRTPPVKVGVRVPVRVPARIPNGGPTPQGARPHPAAGEPRRGHWVREGARIILYGVYS
jgi:uncharacterized protein (DUF697 family)